MKDFDTPNSYTEDKNLKQYPLNSIILKEYKTSYILQNNIKEIINTDIKIERQSTKTLECSDGCLNIYSGNILLQISALDYNEKQISVPIISSFAFPIKSYKEFCYSDFKVLDYILNINENTLECIFILFLPFSEAPDILTPDSFLEYEHKEDIKNNIEENFEDIKILENYNSSSKDKYINETFKKDSIFDKSLLNLLSFSELEKFITDFADKLNINKIYSSTAFYQYEFSSYNTCNNTDFINNTVNNINYNSYEEDSYFEDYKSKPYFIGITNLSPYVDLDMEFI